MSDWADTRAREWLESLGGRLEGPGPISEAYGWLEVSDENAASLAALLREVADRNTRAAADGTAQAVLAEVRVIVMNASAAGPQSWLDVRDEILARLEALK